MPCAMLWTPVTCADGEKAQSPPFAAAKGVKGENPCGVWGSAPKPNATASTPKRANSPKGDEASGSSAVFGFVDKQKAPPFAAAKGVKGESPCGVWGGAPKPNAAASTPKRANSPKGDEASGSSAMFGFIDKQKAPPFAAAKGVKGESPCGAWGCAPKPNAAATKRKRANSPKGDEASDSGAMLGFMDKQKARRLPCFLLV